jgi:hypothetical protein
MAESNARRRNLPHRPQTPSAIRRLLITSTTWLGVLSTSAAAQQADVPGSSSSSTDTSVTIVAMKEPLQGDHWTFDIRDEITGKIKETRVLTVTDVTPKEIAVRYSISGTDRSGMLVFDRAWNVKSSDSMKYLPNSGLGIVEPLKVGAARDFKVEQTNTEKGFTWKWSGVSKVIGQEKVTTKAGTFDTFKIETTYSFYRTTDPGRKSETVMQGWYAPAIDQWVRRVTVSRTDNLLRLSETSELVEYGRKDKAN